MVYPREFRDWQLELMGRVNEQRKNESGRERRQKRGGKNEKWKSRVFSLIVCMGVRRLVVLSWDMTLSL